MNSQEHIYFINDEITKLEEERKVFSLALFFEDVQLLLDYAQEDTICLTGSIDKQQGLFVVVDPANPESQYPLVRKFWDHQFLGEYNHDELENTLKTTHLVITTTMTPAEFINRYAQDKYAKIYLNESLNENLTDKLPVKSLKI